MHTQSPSIRPTTSAIVSGSCLLAMLHFGRDFLQPIALAAILSLVVAPLIRALGRFGLRGPSAMLTTLLMACICVATAGAVLTSQFINVSAELPQYRAALQRKIEQIRIQVEQPFAKMQASISAVTIGAGASDATVDTGTPLQQSAPPPVPALTANQTLAKLFSIVWGPLGETGLVMVLLVFFLIEHESLQDRLIRLAGQTEISRTLRALGDAAQGVSRFFLSQFLVNTTFGFAIGLALWLMGVPHALLFATLSGILRFVPYLGALVAGAAIACFTAAISPGWTLPLVCVALFGAFELLVSNVVEPKVYGHSTGLSPLAVVVSALFWGTLWGPIGLLISTPLTVCLVVAGRHVKALQPLAILFGQAPNVTVAQRFFQRGLSGETASILRDARAILRRASFARYCDQVLLPGLALANDELRRGLIDAGQQDRLRCTVAEVAEGLASRETVPTRRKRHVSLLDANVGAHLRHLREARLGRWQGSLDVPQRSIVLCVGLASERDELVSELLARALREIGTDARSIMLPLPYEEHDPSKAELVSTVFIPSPLGDSVEDWLSAIAKVRGLLPQALLASVCLPGDERTVPQNVMQLHVDMELRTFEECLAFVAPGKGKG
ncbi:MAG: AI-2E family transporter [Burkholderiaceae bacterium]|nr:AI-2E family transporter [Burkholderiaceae bacterium]